MATDALQQPEIPLINKILLLSISPRPSDNDKARQKKGWTDFCEGNRRKRAASGVMVDSVGVNSVYKQYTPTHQFFFSVSTSFEG